MHREFCTLFDSNYLFKAVAMHRSMRRHFDSFHLTAFCFDDQAKRLLDRLDLPHMSAVSLEELEAFDNELLLVKGDRTSVEYCWTATPVLPLFLFANRALDEVTYVDADLLFFSDPEPLFDEMGDASVLITPHRFSPEYKEHEVNGIYNVQFLTFRRDDHGLTCLNWWHDRCIEWCYWRLEDGKLGDQKYLDDWPERFAGVHVLQHKGGGLAPWNIGQYEVDCHDGRIAVDDEPLVFFHYHRLKLLRGGGYDWHPPGYLISDENRRLIYDPYMKALDESVKEVRSVEPEFDAGMVAPPSRSERMASAKTRWRQRVARLPILSWIRRSLRRDR